MSDVSDILYVARNLRADPETQALGEDSPVLQVIAEQFRALQISVESARFLVHSPRAAAMLAELEQELGILNHNACVASTACRAKEAYEEAKVVPIKRPGAPALRVVK